MSDSLKKLLKPLSEQLARLADPATKAWWENYVKQSAPFYGVPMAQTRKLLHQWHQPLVDGAMGAEQQVMLALALIELPHTEEKLAGILFLQEILLPQGAVNGAKHLNRIAELFDNGHIGDWNCCDWFCIKVLGPLIQQHGSSCARRVSGWHRAKNLWRARAGAVAFVNLADIDDYHTLIESSCATLIARPERFAKTAVGWALREVSKHNSKLAAAFVEEHLANFSLESLRNATKHFSKPSQKRYVEKLKKLA